jgi:hypothetical protein
LLRKNLNLKCVAKLADRRNKAITPDDEGSASIYVSQHENQ